MKRKKTTKIVINISIALFFIVCVIAPILSMLRRITPSGLKKVIASAQFSSAVVNSITTSLTATLISIVLALLAAWCLERTTIKGKAVFSMVFIVPMLIPSISHAFGLVALFGANGLVTNALSIKGNIYGFWGIVIGSIMYSFPVAFLMFASILQYEDASPYKAAEVLGISTFHT